VEKIEFNNQKKLNSTLLPPFAKMTSQIMSFYIPRMRTFWTQDQIAALLYHSIGVVDRVDYGDYSPANQTYTGYTFVHFSEICQENREWIDREIYSKGHCRIQVAFDEFWMLIPNRNPIPTTHLNIHQLADTLKKQADQISTLETMVYYLQSQLEARCTQAPDYRTINRFGEKVSYGDVSPMSISQSDDDDYADMPGLIPITSDNSSQNL
jgi:hypothetical protein